MHDKVVLKVSVAEKALVYEWAEDWQAWAELQDHYDHSALKERISKMLEAASKGKGKKGS